MVPVMLQPIIAVFKKKAFGGKIIIYPQEVAKMVERRGDFWNGRVRILADLFPNKTS